MPLEIERRFLAKASADLLRSARPIRMRQAYITVRDLTTVRIREEGDSWVLAIKADASGFSRHEIEVEVPEADGRALFDLAAGGSVEKTRFESGRWEIDVYTGRYAGLTIAEVELEAEDEPLPELPDGLELLRELTGDTGLSARWLAALDEERARALMARLLGTVR